MNQVLDEARAKGILVLAVNGDLVGNEEHRDANILPVDFTKTGPNQVELMGSLIGYEGEIAILSATTEAPDQNTWIAAMKKTLAEDPKYKDMKLVATVYGDDQPEKSTTEMEALLSNYPDLEGVIAPTTVGVAAAAQVVQSRGIADTVHVTGLGLPSEMRDFVKDGTVTAFQLWSPYNEGWLAAYFADGVLERHDQERARHDVRGAEPRHHHHRRQERHEHPGRAHDVRRQEHRRLQLLRPATTRFRGRRRATAAPLSHPNGSRP